MDVLGKDRAARVFRAYDAYNPAAQKGVIAVLGAEPAVQTLGPDTLNGILENFPRGVRLDGNALATDEALFEMIGDLTDVGADGVLRMKDGLDATVRDLGSDFFSFAQGATLDLRVARDLGRGRVLAFQRTVPVPGTTRTRRMDVVEDCGAGCQGLPGILHENKNFTEPVLVTPQQLANPQVVNGVFTYTDHRLTTLGDEFARDVLIHQGTRFDAYRLNVRVPSARDVDVITQVQIKQFDSPLVTSVITNPNVRDELKDEFLSRLNTVVIVHP